MINFLVTAALVFVILVAGYRMLLLAGVPVSMQNARLDAYLSVPSPFGGMSPSRRDYARLALCALLLRLGVYALSAFFICFFGSSEGTLSGSSFLEHWHRWDASNYIRIATGGYRYHLENGEPTTLVFFPLYSIFIKEFYFLIHNYDISALVVSTLFYVGGACYLFGFVSYDYGKKIGYRTVLYLSIFPFSFFFGGMMPESIFLFTSCGFFYYLRRHNWVMVAIFCYLSSLSRLQGILLILPAGIEWLCHYQPVRLLCKKRFSAFFRSLRVLVSPCFSLLGMLTYLWINYRVSGNWFKFLELQETVWHHQYEYVGKAITTIINYTHNGAYDAKMVCVLWLPQAVIAIASLVLLVYAANKHKPQYVFYLAAYTIVSFSASFILSGGRYMSVAVPLFIILAAIGEKHRRLHIAYVIVSSMLFAVYMAGYLLGYQIM